MSLRDPDDPRVEGYNFAFERGLYDTRPVTKCAACGSVKTGVGYPRCRDKHEEGNSDGAATTTV